jgi:hypothetical protein
MVLQRGNKYNWLLFIEKKRKWWLMQDFELQVLASQCKKLIAAGAKKIADQIQGIKQCKYAKLCLLK